MMAASRSITSCGGKYTSKMDGVKLRAGNSLANLIHKIDEQ
jgi:hypothetical protein